LSEKQKQVLGFAHGRAIGGTGRAKLSSAWLSLICCRHGLCLIFLQKIFIFLARISS